MTDIVEGLLTFTFPDDWQVIKYDQPDGYHDYAKDCLKETKAVDIIARSNSKLLMIEVKDFRDFGIENRERLSSGELVIEVAQKVRDSFAVLYGAHRKGRDEMRPFCEQLFCRHPISTEVILFAEQDADRQRSKKFRRNTSDMKVKLERALGFLSVRCRILGRRSMGRQADWSVRSGGEPVPQDEIQRQRRQFRA